MIKEKLAELYRDTKGCINHGDYKLASGIDSKYYIDSKKVTLSGLGLNLIAEHLLYQVKKYCPNINMIGGMTLGADSIVSGCVALWKLPINGFIIRKQSKEHGTKKRIEGPLEKWHQVALIEDVTTTGSTLLEASQVLYSEMGIVSNIAFTIIDREYGASEMLANAGIELHSILTPSDFGEIKCLK